MPVPLYLVGHLDAWRVWTLLLCRPEVFGHTPLVDIILVGIHVHQPLDGWFPVRFHRHILPTCWVVFPNAVTFAEASCRSRRLARVFGFSSRARLVALKSTFYRQNSLLAVKSAKWVLIKRSAIHGVIRETAEERYDFCSWPSSIGQNPGPSTGGFLQPPEFLEQARRPGTSR